MFTSGPAIFVLVCLLALASHAQDISIDIDIDIEDVPDPCDEHQCLAGEKCEPVLTPLMKLPVAHCVSVNSDKDSATCVEYSINTNLISCKSQEEWEDICRVQCSLRSDRTRTLVEATVKYNCQSFHSSKTTKYMSADFTCCSDEQKPETTPSPPEDSSRGNPHTSQETGLLNAADPSSPSSTTLLIPIIIGAMVLLVLVTLILVVWQMRRSRPPRPHRKLQVDFATSFVNPSADHQQTEHSWVAHPLDTTDKSLLIVNEHPRE